MSMSVAERRWLQREIGYRVRVLRQRKGMSQPKAREVLALSRQKIDDIERGKCKLSFVRLAAMLETYAASVNEAAQLVALELAWRVLNIEDHQQTAALVKSLRAKRTGFLSVLVDVLSVGLDGPPGSTARPAAPKKERSVRSADRSGSQKNRPIDHSSDYVRRMQGRELVAV